MRCGAVAFIFSIYLKPVLYNVSPYLVILVLELGLYLLSLVVGAGGQYIHYDVQVGPEPLHGPMQPHAVFHWVEGFHGPHGGSGLLPGLVVLLSLLCLSLTE